MEKNWYEIRDANKIQKWVWRERKIIQEKYYAPNAIINCKKAEEEKKNTYRVSISKKGETLFCHTRYQNCILDAAIYWLFIINHNKNETMNLIHLY